MLSVSFDRAVGEGTEAAVRELEEIAVLIRDEHYPEALRRLLAKAEFQNAAMNADFIREACFYYFALFSLRAGERSAIDELSFVTGPVRFDAALLDYAEHRRRVDELLARQRAAEAHGYPSILILSLPKSASALLSNSLADALGLALVRVDYEDDEIDDALLKHFALGGCVTHNHLPASPQNLSALQRLWNGPVFVQVRDPRAAVWSMYHHVNKLLYKASLEQVVDAHYHRYVRWIDGWLAARESVPDVELLRFEQVTGDLDGVMRRLLERRGAPAAAFAALAERNRGSETFNLRSGDPDEWRRALPPSLQRRLREETPRRVLNFFERG